MANKIIQFKRGLNSSIPNSARLGEPIFVIDTGQLFIGQGEGLPLKEITAEEKTIVFVYDLIAQGTHGFEFKFPYNGIITKVDANCVLPGTAETEIAIEKITNIDYMLNRDTWENIFLQNMIFNPGEKFHDKTHKINKFDVNQNDYFRVNIIKNGDLQKLNVQITIKIIS